MQLKKLEAYGFKSFADKIEVDFDRGITAIVGPNGSGKSNISDAIKWVLGEQNVRNIRGVKAEDIIFAGSESRRSMGVAEVSLYFDNNDGTLPVDFREVVVTRRLFRTGESEFYINKSRCRLKDIVNLFADSGIGHDSMGIISQNKMDEILRAMHRPDTKEEISTLLAKLRQRIPGVVIRSTFIVGFPGETEAQYQELKAFLEEQRFDHVGIFTYSKEEDTAAAEMPNQVPEEIMEDRYHDLKATQSLISQELNQQLEGQVLEVLVEGHTDEGMPYGRSYRQADDVDDNVYIEDDTTSKVGDMVKVRILQGFTEDLVGELADV